MDAGLNNTRVPANNTHSFLKEPSPELSQVCLDSLDWFYDHHYDSSGLEIGTLALHLTITPQRVELAFLAVELTAAQAKANASSHRSLRFRSLTSRRRQPQPKLDQIFTADSADAAAMAATEEPCERPNDNVKVKGIDAIPSQPYSLIQGMGRHTRSPCVPLSSAITPDRERPRCHYGTASSRGRKSPESGALSIISFCTALKALCLLSAIS